jgi:hypothetical protein
VGEASDQQLRVLGRERLEQHVGRVELAARPSGPAVEELGPGHAQEQDGRVPGQVRHVLDQVEEGLLAPVQVVEDAHDRLLGGRGLELLAEGPGDLLARRDELSAAAQCPDRLSCRSVQVRLRKLLQHLHHRPVGDALAVRQAAPASDGGLAERGDELGREAGLAHSGGTEDREELAGALGDDALPRVREQPLLALTSHHGRHVPPRELARDREQPVGVHALGLPPQLERLHRLHLDSAPDEPERLGADQDLARLRRLLEPSGHVDGVSGGQPLLRSGHHLAGRDADPALDAQLRERVAHLHRRPRGPQSVVLVHDRHAEDGHDRVADELLHRPSVPLQNDLHAPEVAGEQRAQSLGVELLAQRGGAGHVAEEHRDRLPLLALRGRLREGGSAGVAEARALGNLVAAARAGGHGEASLRLRRVRRLRAREAGLTGGRSPGRIGAVSATEGERHARGRTQLHRAGSLGAVRPSRAARGGREAADQRRARARQLLSLPHRRRRDDRDRLRGRVRHRRVLPPRGRVGQGERPAAVDPPEITEGSAIIHF